MSANRIFGILLLAVPLAVAARLLDWPPVAVFALSGLAIVPLAKWIGTATEHLATHAGAGVGGLLNATFGNATELIISLFALQAGLVNVVKASLTGSIIGNILLVLGLAIVVGGWRRERQVFNRTAAGTMATQLTLAVIGLLIPAAFYYTLSSAGAAHRNGLEEQVSVAVALLLILSYGLGLLFSLRTHSHLYTPEDEEAMHGGAWSVRRSLAVLLLATAGAALMSEILVRSLEDAAHVLGWSEVFVGVIIVPIIGNAAEHLTAVTVAWKDKMDLSLSIALGSSIQIALLVAPLLVLLSFAFSHHMNLLWDSFELVAITLAVLIARFVAEDGESTWYEGAQLLTAYGVVAVAFYLHE